MNNKLIVFPLFFFLFLTISANAAILDYTYDIADARVWDNNNRGSETIMDAYNISGIQEYSYMKWNTSYLYNITITSANLTLYLVQSDVATAKNISIYNTSNNWTETNISWANKTPFYIWISNTTVPKTLGYYNFSITEALQNAIDEQKPLNLIVYNPQQLAGYNMYRFATKENTNNSLRPYLTIEYNVSGFNCSTSRIGTYCDIEDGLPDTIVTRRDFSCTNDTFYACPNGTYCTQVSPIANFSSNIVQEVLGNIQPEYSDYCLNCFFINWLNPIPNPHYVPLVTNCWDTTTIPPHIKTECNCIGTYCAPSIYETDNSIQNNTKDEWTAACYNPYTQRYLNDSIINSTGQWKNFTIFINDTCPDCNLTNTSLPSLCQNTSTNCYDVNCLPTQCSTIVSTTCSSNYGGQAALYVSSLFGVTDCGLSMNVFSIIASLLIGLTIIILLGYYADIGGKTLGTIFIFAELLFLVFFTLMGWFPSWLIVILIVISALGVGGVLGGLVGG